MTLKLYGVRLGESLDCSCTSHDLDKDAFHLSQTKAAVQLLSKMRGRLTEDMKTSQERVFKESSSISPLSKVEQFPSAVTSEDIAVDVAAHCLFKHVEHQLQYGGKFSILCIKYMHLFSALFFQCALSRFFLHVKMRVCNHEKVLCYYLQLYKNLKSCSCLI